MPGPPPSPNTPPPPPPPEPMVEPHVSSSHTQDEVIRKKFGLTAAQLARAKSLRRMGVTEEDLAIAGQVRPARGLSCAGSILDNCQPAHAGANSLLTNWGLKLRTTLYFCRDALALAFEGSPYCCCYTPSSTSYTSFSPLPAATANIRSLFSPPIRSSPSCRPSRPSTSPRRARF